MSVTVLGSSISGRENARETVEGDTPASCAT
jgi:hypothetical protein